MSTSEIMHSLFSTHPMSVHWVQELNGTVTPFDVKRNNQSKKFWFKCPDCGHIFDSIIRSISLGAWCGFCGGKRMCSKSDCDFCHNNSFASHPKARFWSRKNTVSPRDVRKSCNRSFIFDCDRCNTEITMNLNNISAGKWCNKCGRVSASDKQRMTLDDFIRRSKEAHGEKYDYSEVVLSSVDNRVTIICPEHGRFTQTPYHHYTGSNCHECARIQAASSRKYSFEEFLELARKTHGNTYDYAESVSKYTDMNHTRIPIRCRIHGLFEQYPSVHVKCGCPACGVIRMADTQRMTTAEFIRRSCQVHGDMYDYSQVVYVRGHDNVIILCRSHGPFEQDPYNHLGGSGCPKCTHKTEGKMLEYLKTTGFDVVVQFAPVWCRQRGCFRYDFYIPSLNLIIELDGEQHFKSVSKWKNSGITLMKRDVYKMRAANSNGLRLIRIMQQLVWDNDTDWLNTNLLPHLVNLGHVENVYIGSKYEEHTRFMTENISIAESELYDD